MKSPEDEGAALTVPAAHESPEGTQAMSAPDLALAGAFIEALSGSPDAAVTWQTFSDVKDAKAENDPLAKWMHGTLGRHAAELRRRNEQGAGIFVMANEGDGCGRKARNVLRVRAVFVDQDKPPLRPFSLPPSFIVRTSPGRYQAFWRVVDDVPLEDFTPMQERLAAFYGGDLAVKDLPHVVRMPGFHHRKREPALVTFEHGSRRAHTLEEILAAHPVERKKPATVAAQKAKTEPPTGSRREALVRVVRKKAAERSWAEGDRHASAKATAAHGRKLGLEAGDLATIVTDLLLAAGKTEREAEDIVKWTLENVSPDPKEAERPKPVSAAASTDSDDAPEAPPQESEGETTSEPAFPSPLAPEAFHGLAGEFVRLVSPHTEADEAALLAHFLVYFGNAVGRDAFYRVGATPHTCAENVAFVGTTGSGRKGTAEHETRRPFILSLDPWTARITTGLSSGEGLIHAVRDPSKKLEPIKKGGHTTGYEEVTADQGVSDKRLCVLESELGRVLRVMDRDGNTLSATVREAWDARQVLRTLTKNSPSVATGAHVSILGHITRDELLRYLNRTETANGFGNRFLWIAVRRSKFLPDGGSLRDGDLGRFASKLGEALAAARNVREMRRDDEARAVWHAVYPHLEAGRAGLLGAVTGRAAAHVLRLSMIYALMDGSEEIRAPHIDAALSLWTYSEDSARFVFGDATGDPEADAILDALRTTPRLSRDSIRDLFSRHVPAQRIAAALAVLAKLGKAHMEIEKTKGRPVSWWIRGPSRCAESAESAKSPSETAGTDGDTPFPRLERLSRMETQT